MKVFIDTEFTGLHRETTLISLGMVAETGQTFYAEFSDFDESQLNGWLTENVVSKLLFWKLKDAKLFQVERKRELFCNWDDQHNVEMLGNTDKVCQCIMKWLNSISKDPNCASEHSIEIWGDNIAFDWVLFCDLFGHALNLPPCIQYIPFDIATLFRDRGMNPELDRAQFAGMERKEQNIHNALWDAKVAKACYEKIVSTAA